MNPVFQTITTYLKEYTYSEINVTCSITTNTVYTHLHHLQAVGGGGCQLRAIQHILDNADLQWIHWHINNSHDQQKSCGPTWCSKMPLWKTTTPILAESTKNFASIGKLTGKLILMITNLLPKHHPVIQGIAGAILSGSSIMKQRVRNAQHHLIFIKG